MDPFEIFSNSSMLHAAIVHVPIVFVLLGVPLIYYLAISQQKTEALRWFTVGFYAIATLVAYLAMVTGRGAIDRIPNDQRVSEQVWKLVGQHEEMGEKVWIMALVVTAILASSAVPVKLLRQTFVGVGMLAAIGLAVWVAVLGHFGGMLVYDHGIGTPAMGEAIPVGPAGASGANELVPAIRPIDAEAAKSIGYAKDVLPILKENCEKCHNPDKMRGDFDSTLVAAIIEGGKKGGAGIVPGKPDEGSLVTYIRGEKQPQMPKGEDPLTEDQLHVIRQWIAAGAIDDSSSAPAPAAPPAAAGPAPTAESPSPTAEPAPAAGPAQPAPTPEAPVAESAEAAPG